MDNIDYQLVSIAVVLRDETSNLRYKNEEHKRLTDIADTLWNANIPVSEWNDNPEYDYKALYAKYSRDFWDKVMRDISAIKSQLNSSNLSDLIQEYQELMEG